VAWWIKKKRANKKKKKLVDYLNLLEREIKSLEWRWHLTPCCLLCCSSMKTMKGALLQVKKKRLLRNAEILSVAPLGKKKKNWESKELFELYVYTVQQHQTIDFSSLPESALLFTELLELVYRTRTRVRVDSAATIERRNSLLVAPGSRIHSFY
jgi:hypothetical protein